MGRSKRKDRIKQANNCRFPFLHAFKEFNLPTKVQNIYCTTVEIFQLRSKRPESLLTVHTERAHRMFDEKNRGNCKPRELTTEEL